MKTIKRWSQGSSDDSDSDSDLDEIVNVSVDNETCGSSSGVKDYSLDSITNDPYECYKFEVFSLDDLARQQNEIVETVCGILNITPKKAEALLNKFKWDKQRFLEKYFDGNNDTPSPLKTSEISTVKKCNLCQISTDPLFDLDCQHQFCLTCWKRYMKDQFDKGNFNKLIACPLKDCNITIDENIFIAVAEDMDIQNLYKQLLMDRYIENNPLLHWCPSVDCTYAIMVTSVDSRPVVCKCGREFCFQCGRSSHVPVRCFLLKKWKKIYNSLSNEKSHSALSPIKACPQCYFLVEKKVANNHMVCANEGCMYEFCWLCLSSWGTHNSEYFCNTYGQNNERIQMLNPSCRTMVRYMYYYNRYNNHMHCLQLGDELQLPLAHKLSSFEVEHLNRGIKTLTRCRRALMFSYVLGYFVKPSNQSVIFEENQKNLELAVEKLLGIVECQRNMTQFNQNFHNVYQYCSKCCKVLLNHVYEGYEECWWEYIE